MTHHYNNISRIRYIVCKQRKRIRVLVTTSKGRFYYLFRPIVMALLLLPLIMSTVLVVLSSPRWILLPVLLLGNNSILPRCHAFHHHHHHLHRHLNLRHHHHQQQRTAIFSTRRQRSPPTSTFSWVGGGTTTFWRPALQSSSSSSSPSSSSYFHTVRFLSNQNNDDDDDDDGPKNEDIIQLQASVSASKQQASSRSSRRPPNDDDDDDDDGNASSLLPPLLQLVKEQEVVVTEDEHLRHQQDVFDSISGWFADREKEVTPELEPVYEAMAQDILGRLLLQQQQNIDPVPVVTIGDADADADADAGEEEEEEGEVCRTLHILDVACGTGVLWEFLIQAANDQAKNSGNVQLRITGVDLSPSMVEHAAKRAQFLLSSSSSSSSEEDQTKKNKKNQINHSIQIVTSDILTFCQTTMMSNDDDGDAYYDGAILNACYGNFYNPTSILEALRCPSIIISHPLGSAFVQELHDQDPKTVPHVLPSSTLEMVQQQQSWTSSSSSSSSLSSSSLSSPPISNPNNYLTPTYFKAKPYYLMALQRNKRAKPLTVLHRYRGVVDQGYGRGGKKLGVPTANLPASLFQNALQDVRPGVYFGWAALEEEEHLPPPPPAAAAASNVNHPRVFPAVVNVGYSPTFEGQENKEKIIEAHLIVTKQNKKKDGNSSSASSSSGDDTQTTKSSTSTFALQDFYGQVLRLQLNGYLRDEQKFDSFPALVAQIHADIADAQEALQSFSPFMDLQHDDFLLKTQNENSPDCWIGTGGGDETASWEFVDYFETLTAMVNNKGDATNQR